MASARETSRAAKDAHPDRRCLTHQRCPRLSSAAPESDDVIAFPDGFLRLSSCERAAHLRAEGRRSAVGADVYGRMPAANADLTVRPADLPNVGDRARADFFWSELDLELVLKAQDGEVLGLDSPARVIRPVFQQP